MARKWLTYKEGTPQRLLLDAVDRRHGDSERFFEAVAAATEIKPDSASGTFYGFLRGHRALPGNHRAAYLKILKIDPEVLDRIDALRTKPLATRERRDRLEEVARQGDKNRAAIEAVVARLAELEADLVPSARRSTRRRKDG